MRGDDALRPHERRGPVAAEARGPALRVARRRRRLQAGQPVEPPHGSRRGRRGRGARDPLAHVVALLGHVPRLPRGEVARERRQAPLARRCLPTRETRALPRHGQVAADPQGRRGGGGAQDRGQGLRGRGAQGAHGRLQRAAPPRAPSDDDEGRPTTKLAAPVRRRAAGSRAAEASRRESDARAAGQRQRVRGRGRRRARGAARGRRQISTISASPRLVRAGATSTCCGPPAGRPRR